MGRQYYQTSISVIIILLGRQHEENIVEKARAPPGMGIVSPWIRIEKVYRIHKKDLVTFDSERGASVKELSMGTIQDVDLQENTKKKFGFDRVELRMQKVV